MKKLTANLIAAISFFAMSTAFAETSLTLKAENISPRLKNYNLTVIGDCSDEKSPIRIKSFNEDATYTLTAADLAHIKCSTSDGKPWDLILHVSGPDALPPDTDKPVILPNASIKCGTVPISATDSTAWLLTFGVNTSGLYCKLNQTPTNKPN